MENKEYWSKPGIWKFLPGFVARYKIRKIKRLSGLNQMRRKLNSTLERRLSEETGMRQAAEAIVEENAEKYAVIQDAHNIFTQLEVAKATAIYMHQLGPASKSGELNDEERASLELIADRANVNSILQERVDVAEQEIRGIIDGFDKERKSLFDSGMAATAKPYEALPWIVYAPGKIIKTSNSFNKRFGKNKAQLSERLNLDNDLHRKLAKGEVVRIDFESGYLEFVPREKEDGNKDPRTVATASYIPGNRISRAFARNAENAVAEINKYLAGVNIGLMGADTTMGTNNGK
jgi:hypothetical protein